MGLIGSGADTVVRNLGGPGLDFCNCVYVTVSLTIDFTLPFLWILEIPSEVWINASIPSTSSLNTLLFVDTVIIFIHIKVTNKLYFNNEIFYPPSALINYESWIFFFLLNISSIGKNEKKWKKNKTSELKKNRGYIYIFPAAANHAGEREKRGKMAPTNIIIFCNRPSSFGGIFKYEKGISTQILLFSR